MTTKIRAGLLLAALAVASLGFSAAPASADMEVAVSPTLNRCSVATSGGTGRCFFLALPDVSNTLRLTTSSHGYADVTCDGISVAFLSRSSGGTSSSSGWSNPGGACTLTVFGGGSASGAVS